MKKIYLTKMYIKWNDEKVSSSKYRRKARAIMAFSSKKRALISLKSMIERAKKDQNSLYKKYFFIEEMILH